MEQLARHLDKRSLGFSVVYKKIAKIGVSLALVVVAWYTGPMLVKAAAPAIEYVSPFVNTAMEQAGTRILAIVDKLPEIMVERILPLPRP